MILKLYFSIVTAPKQFMSHDINFFLQKLSVQWQKKCYRNCHKLLGK